MARVKKVFSSVDEITHLWAHQTQTDARLGKTRERGGWNSYSSGGIIRASFDGPAFRSYNTVIAIITRTKTGETAYLITDQKYSVTTAKHQSEVRSAIPRNATVVVAPAGGGRLSRYGHPDVSDDHEGNLALMNSQIAEAVDESKKARMPKSQRLLVEAWNYRQRAIAYAEMFDCGEEKVADFPYTDGQMKETVAAYQHDCEHREAVRSARWAEKRRLEREAWEAAAPARAEAERKRAAEQAEAIQIWRDGGPRGYWHGVPTMLRIKDGIVQTSKGADFPIDHAKRGLALVRSVIARGEEWRTNGHTCHLGHYKIDRITKDGTVYAGCHEVRWEEIERIAAQLEAA